MSAADPRGARAGIVGAVGNTPLVELKRVVPATSARVLVKLESQNPTVSMKNRMALSVVDRGLASGRLRPDGRLMARAAELSAEPMAFFADQFNNPGAAAGYTPLAEEVWAQTGRSLAAFVQAVGTAQCITGVARALRDRNPGIGIVAVGPLPVGPGR